MKLKYTTAKFVNTDLLAQQIKLESIKCEVLFWRAQFVFKEKYFIVTNE